MFVTFICMSEKRAIGRVRRVLDRYASRIGKQTWQTPITMEALDDVFQALRRSATKNTAIACYRNAGNRTMKLLWIVGKRDTFGADGTIAVAHHTRSTSYMPVWVKTAALIAQTAGQNHDIGKATVRFQGKLKASVQGSTSSLKDRIRHEWLSLRVYEHWRDEMEQWESDGSVASERPRLHESFARIRPHTTPKLLHPKKLVEPLSSLVDALDLAILTHHGLLGIDAQDAEEGITDLAAAPGETGHVVSGREITQEQPDALYKALPEDAEFEIETELRLWSLTKRVYARQAEYGANPHYARAIALVSRAALIAADHQVSSRRYQRKLNPRRSIALYANTKPLKSNPAKRSFDQPLDWHLSEVSRMAGIWVHRIASTGEQFFGVSDGSRDRLQKKSNHPRFAWQDEAATRMRNSIADNHRGALVFNMAGTGSGKTLANMKMAEALTPDNQSFRVSIGLNLRSLTLQTAGSLRAKSGLMASEMAFAIGDRFSQSMYQQSGTPDEDNDDGSPYDMDVAGGEGADHPEWFDEWIRETLGKRSAHAKKLMTAPVLVSTSDYLVDAGNPGSQGRHVLALLRIASSDLILDEIDQYDPQALIAMARTIQLSSLFNQNVIVSSATLSEPVAKVVMEAYLTGARMRDALSHHAPESKATTPIWLVDDALDAERHDIEDAATLDSILPHRMARLMVHVAGCPVLRLATIQRITPPRGDPQEQMAAATKAAIQSLHKNHSWIDPQSGKRLSFGVVRVANIKPCVALAQKLAGDGIYVTAYHAQDLRGRRWLKEQLFDEMFDRTDSPDQPALHPHMRKIIDESTHSEIVFAVVATPVEEVGRDHDFDWAVIEPSSVASIVQMAGRVNRHRLTPVASPNIAILDRNLRSLKGEAKCFSRPGNEHSFPDTTGQTMTQLLADAWGWTEHRFLPINSTLQFGHNGHRPLFAKLDEVSFQNGSKEGLAALDGLQEFPNSWMAKPYYQEYCLRKKDQQMKGRYRFARDALGSWGAEELHINHGIAGDKDWRSINVEIETTVTGDQAPYLWASWTFDQLADHLTSTLTDHPEIYAEAFEVTLARPHSTRITPVFHESFAGPFVTGRF